MNQVVVEQADEPEFVVDLFDADILPAMELSECILATN